MMRYKSNTVCLSEICGYKFAHKHKLKNVLNAFKQQTDVTLCKQSKEDLYKNKY